VSNLILKAVKKIKIESKAIISETDLLFLDMKTTTDKSETQVSI
jgi:hypothetical protein